MKRHVLILGAGFGGLELATRLSESLADEVHVTLVDQNDAFVSRFPSWRYSSARQTRDEVSSTYRDISRPGVIFRLEQITSMYSVSGAERLGEAVPSFSGGKVLIAILGVPFKCPPAPYEGALLLHDYLAGRGVRDVTQIDVISPMESPIPVSPETSEAIVRALGERDIGYTPSRRVRELDPTAHVAQLRTGDIPDDLFIGIPVHRAPAVVEASGLTVGGTDGWVAVDPRYLATPFPNLYALGDCADAPVPRAGVFAETAARTVADHITGEDPRLWGGQAVRRHGVWLHRVRRGIGGKGRRRLPVWADAEGAVPRPNDRVGQGEGTVRRDSTPALVRHLIPRDARAGEPSSTLLMASRDSADDVLYVDQPIRA